jgi:hypothetical protein
LLCAIFSLSAPAFAGTGTGVGVMVGSPNGITARQWIDDAQSVDAAAGWSLIDSHFQVNANYLWSQPEALQLGDRLFDAFFGLGLSLRTKSGAGDEVVFGPRLPAGLSYEFANPDVELFTQVALNVGLVPSSDLYLDANIGLRFYF